MSEEIIPQLEAPLAPVPVPVRDPAWGYAEIALVIVTFFSSMMLCGVIGVFIAGKMPGFQGLPPQQIAINPLFFVPLQFAAYLVTFVVVRVAVVSRSGKGFWESIRWQMPAAEPIFMYVLVGILLAITVQILSAFLPFPKSLPMHQYFREVRFAYMMAVFGVFVAPLAEEVFFRGLVFPVLARTAGQTASIAITGLVFSLMHQGQLARAWAPLAVLFGVGVILTVIRARSNSVAASWIAHVAYNSTLFATIFYFSDGFRNMPR